MQTKYSSDINITRSYSRYLFNKELEVAPWILAANKCDLYIFLTTDCEYVQDGTRLGNDERYLLAEHHEQFLIREGVNYVKIGGDWNERFETAKQLIENTLLA